jgi:hypothetical protein
VDIRELSETVSALIQRKEFAEAETLLLEVRREAEEKVDLDTVDFVLSELTAVCCQMEPPDITRAAEFCREREAARNTGYNKWQTAMMFYWSAHNYSQTVTKAREAVQKATEEGDTKTAYSALSLLGLTLLELDRTDDAAAILGKIEDMIRQRKSLVVGDETLFLERANVRGLERPTIRRIANILAPVCRDAMFASRLQALSVIE